VCIFADSWTCTYYGDEDNWQYTLNEYAEIVRLPEELREEWGLTGPPAILRELVWAVLGERGRQLSEPGASQPADPDPLEALATSAGEL
jgi:hypothetical protein